MVDSMDVIWQKTLKLLESDLNKISFETWLKGTRPISMQPNLLTIVVENEFAKEWLENRYFNIISNTIEILVGRKMELHFITASAQKEKPKPTNLGLGTSERVSPLPLNPKYTFDSFVVGNSNRFAHAASLAVAETPAKAYNPLFIYGGVGLGKTHLMHAIGHFVSNNSNLRVVYTTSETFTNELINSIRDDLTVAFRNRYRNIDVLLIDDIQFLAGKERTQEEFFHTFNVLHEANKQIIISSDRPPKDIPTLEDRLRSRFEWGLLTDIQPPDLETRIAILRKKASLEGVSFPDDVLDYVANRIQSNIRELEGALTRVAAFASFNDQPITLEIVSHVLKDIVPEKAVVPITIPRIQETVAGFFSLRVEDLKAKKRNRAISLPRQIAMYLCRNMTDSSLPQIGNNFGGRDHTTVLHACDKISTLIENDHTMAGTILRLRQNLMNQ